MQLFNYFEKWNAVVVAETYTSAWSLRLNPDKPLESIAYKSLVSYLLISCVSLNKRIELITKAICDYKFDGDHMDGEKFSMAQFQARIDAFMEIILEKKRASRSSVSRQIDG